MSRRARARHLFICSIPGRLAHGARTEARRCCIMHSPALGMCWSHDFGASARGAHHGDACSILGDAVGSNRRVVVCESTLWGIQVDFVAGTLLAIACLLGRTMGIPWQGGGRSTGAGGGMLNSLCIGL